MSESRAGAASPAASMVGWLKDELAHAAKDKERVERRIDRPRGRIAAAEVTQGPDVEILTRNDQRDDEKNR